MAAELLVASARRHADLDSNFGALCFEIEQRSRILDKNAKVFVSLWLKKLSYSQSSNIEV